MAKVFIAIRMKNVVQHPNFIVVKTNVILSAYNKQTIHMYSRFAFAFFLLFALVSCYCTITAQPKRHLIYICFTGGKYFQIAKLLISSIGKNVNRKDVDMLIRTDNTTMPAVEKWLGEYKKICPNQNIRFKVHESAKKMFQYRFEIDDNFKDYDKVLYLDTDILIANSHIDSLFDVQLNHNTVYVVHESSDFNRHEWAYQKYTRAQIQSMMNRNIFPFNNGQFMFRYSPSMKQHFDNVVTLTESKPYNSFIDQQSMNHYFNTRFLTDGNMLKEYTRLFATDQTVPQYTESIMHFSGNIHQGEWKLDIMKRYLINNGTL